MVVKRDDKVYIRKNDLSGVNYVVKHLDEDGNVEEVKKYGGPFEWPFRRHRLVGGPLDGETVYLKKSKYWYDVELEDGSELYCYSGPCNSEKAVRFTFDKTIKTK